MVLTEFLESPEGNMSVLAKQLGIKNATIRLSEKENTDITDNFVLKTIISDYRKNGFTVRVIEPMPNMFYESVKMGLPDRDMKIEKIIKLINNLGRMDVEVICANFMAKIGWFRTDMDIETRGGALVTGFDFEKTDRHLNDDPVLTQEKICENLEYFLKAIKPHLEKSGIKLALHPDDPPIPYLNGVGRVLISADAVEKAVEIVSSPNIGITMCQGTFAAMGEDIPKTIKRFKDKIFFVHFRDITGNRNKFEETFHDAGQTDMAAAVKTYNEIGYRGYIRVDHVPTMAYEKNIVPGYENMGRLFAVGYLKGLIEAFDSD